MNGDSYVKLSYKVTNKTDESLTGAVGICADVKIGDDDYATVSVVNSKNDEKPIGLKMVDVKKPDNCSLICFSEILREL